MRIAVASGKGGTGKTTIATSLALAADTAVMLLDCDVEEPNARLFLSCGEGSSADVSVMIPYIDPERCTGCGVCAELCEFNAIVVVKGRALVFPDLCHSCGGCALVCPERAIQEVPQSIGRVMTAPCGSVRFAEGELTIGRAMSPPLIRAVKRVAGLDAALVIIDCPPGTSCPMVTAVKGADVIVLVTEPTPFGLHDLTLAVATVRKMRTPFGVVINRADAGDDRVVRYCREQVIPVLLEVPEDRRIAEAYSRGEPLGAAIPSYAGIMRSLLERLAVFAAGGGA